MHVLAAFGVIDWGVVGVYFAVIIAVGFWVAWRDKQKGRGSGAGEYFLGGRSMPTWAVAVSLVATMLSAATFVGVPDISFGGNLSYLMLNLGGIVAVFLVAALFIPKLYAAGTVTIYGFLARRFGPNAHLAVSITFILGRLLSSGARLFVAAIPLCLLLFGAKTPTSRQMVVAILLIGGIGTIYATVGGVRAVVWVDTIQFAIVVGTALLTIGILLHRIPISVPEIVEALRHPAAVGGGGVGGASKLRIVDTSLDPTLPYTIWAALIGNTFVMMAALGTDHDLAQRFLITKSAWKGSVSVIASQFIGMVVVGLFMAIGLLLYIFYRRPEIMGAVHATTEDKISIYPWFLLNELPTGLAGLAIAGFFAIAQGSLDSAMNALAASIVADVYVPLLSRLRPDEPVAEARASKPTVAAVGVGMVLFASGCAAAYNPKNTAIIDFVLGLMTFALSGMLGVFLTALLTKRGNSASVIAALVAGAVTVLLLQNSVMPWWTGHVFGRAMKLAWPWWMPLGTGAAFLVCVAGRPVKQEGATGTRDREEALQVRGGYRGG